MRLLILSLIAIASVNGLQWVGMENLPDGRYRGYNYPNGSTTMTCMHTGVKHNFHLSEEDAVKRMAKRHPHSALAKRFVDCWGYQLDVEGTDRTVEALKGWAGGGRDFRSCERTSYYGFNYKGVYTYYCLNAAHVQGNLNVNDIDEALRAMDATCNRYEASYFRWDGSAELVGKCASGTAVCLG